MAHALVRIIGKIFKASEIFIHPSAIVHPNAATEEVHLLFCLFIFVIYLFLNFILILEVDYFITIGRIFILLL